MGNGKMVGNRLWGIGYRSWVMGYRFIPITIHYSKEEHNEKNRNYLAKVS